MLSSKFIKTSFALGAIAAAAVANAQISLIVVSDGLATLGAGNIITDSETVVAQSPTMGLQTYLATYGNSSGTGTATYTGTMGDLTVSLQYILPNQVFSSPASKSVDGTWTYLSGTGIFAHMAGGGTVGLTYLDLSQTSALAGTELSGTLNAVPEPAPIAALGVGALGLLIRRRKA